MNKVLGKSKKVIGIEFDDSKVLFNTDDKLPNDIILKQKVIIFICVIKHDGNYYPEILLEEAMYD